MTLTQAESENFYKLFKSVCWYVNRHEGCFPEDEDYRTAEAINPEHMEQLFSMFFEDDDLNDSYRKDNPDSFSEEELEIIFQWQNGAKGTFIVERILKKDAMLIGTGERVYQMVGLITEPDEMVYYLPMAISTTLIPYKGRIVYASTMREIPLYFGSGMKKALKNIYLEARANKKIITSLEA